MESLSFRPGRAFLSSNSPIVPWTVVFEDEGVAAYFYACDRSQTTQEEAIQDAMLVYNVGSLKDVEEERIASVAWSRDGLEAVLYLNGTAQAMFDFQQKCGYCRLNFPNFLGDAKGWKQSDHGWNEAAWQRFEAGLLR